MHTHPYKPTRLFRSEKQRSFSPTITNTPDLPAIDWAKAGQSAPAPLSSSGGELPTADVVVLTWADAEWAAMQHVFCAGSAPMPYTDRTKGSWSGWTRYEAGLPSRPPSGWSFWGEWRLVSISGSTVMLFKSNTHLDFPGQSYLEDLIKLLIADVRPSLILSIGTAGGAQTGDHVGTVRAVSSGTLYQAGAAASSWPIYGNDWTASSAVLGTSGFQSLLLPTPTTAKDLQSLCSQLNAYYGTDETLAVLDPNGLNMAQASPALENQTGGALSLLTTPTFVVGTTAGDYQAYACIEMDDAVIGSVCKAAGVAFGFVRNISDPVQNAALSARTQGNWGSAVYDAYGFYTSYNGALAAWAMLAARSPA